MFRDMKTRIFNIRIDSLAVRQKIEVARRFIFEKGYGVRSAAVKRLLDAKCLLPVQVCSHSHSVLVNICWMYIPERFLSSA